MLGDGRWELGEERKAVDSLFRGNDNAPFRN